MIKWIEEFEGCGCTHEASVKRDLVGYCGIHGGNRKGLYKLEAGKPVKWMRKGELVSTEDGGDEG